MGFVVGVIQTLLRRDLVRGAGSRKNQPPRGAEGYELTAPPQPTLSSSETAMLRRFDQFA